MCFLFFFFFTCYGKKLTVPSGFRERTNTLEQRVETADVGLLKGSQINMLDFVYLI